MNWTNIKNSIDAAITSNDNQEITGAVLRNTLKNIIDAIGANASYGGIAHIADNPGTPDGPVVYIASDQGIYPNFGALEVDTDELAVFDWNPTTGTWTKESITYIADKSEMEDLIRQGIEDINDTKNDAIEEIEQIVQNVDVTYETISGNNVQLKNGSGDLLMPNIAQNDEREDELSISDDSGNVVIATGDSLKFKGNSVPTEKGSQPSDDIVFSDGENEIMSINNGRIKSVNFDSNFPDQKLGLLLPDYVNSWVGDNIQLFKFPITLTPVTDLLSVNFCVDSSDANVKKLGRTLRRYFEFTPAAAGNYTIKANVLDYRRRIHERKAFQIRVKTPSSPSTMKNFLFIGDSETEGLMNNSQITSAMGASEGNDERFPYTNEVKRLLTGNDSSQPGLPASIGLSNIQLIGTQNQNGGRHEGYSGKDIDWFLSSSSPFYVGGKIDFNAYLAQNSVYSDTSHKGVDYIYILLGANTNSTFFEYEQDNKIYQIKTNYDDYLIRLIDEIKAQLIDDSSKPYYNPNLKIILLSYAFAYLDGRGYHPNGSNDYGDNIGSLQGSVHCYKVNERIKTLSKYNGIVDSVLISPHIDSENAYAFFQKPKNNYMIETELTRIEAIHPNEIGYRQFGAAVVRDIIGRI